MRFKLWGRIFQLSNMWTFEREIWLTPSVSLNFADGFCFDISFLIWKFYTYPDYFIEDYDNGEN